MATGPVSSPSSILITITPVSASPAMIARLIGAAPRQRGSSEACRLKAPSGHASRIAFGRIKPVGDDDRHVRAVAARNALRVPAAQGGGREHRQGEAARLALDRAWREIEPASSGGLGGARV